jgi:hypothetical protein
LRGSICTRSRPFRTSSPVCTSIAINSPDAFDLTSVESSGTTLPSAFAVTTISRLATATF